jgi:predicted Zn-dependent protease
MMDRLGSAIPTDARQLVTTNALNHWRVVDLLLRADAMMQKYQIVEPEHDNAVALLREVLRIDPKNPIGDEMLSKAYGLLTEAQRRQIVDGPATHAATSG